MSPFSDLFESAIDGRVADGPEYNGGCGGAGGSYGGNADWQRHSPPVSSREWMRDGATSGLEGRFQSRTQPHRSPMMGTMLLPEREPCPFDLHGSSAAGGIMDSPWDRPLPATMLPTSQPGSANGPEFPASMRGSLGAARSLHEYRRVSSPVAAGAGRRPVFQQQFQQQQQQQSWDSFGILDGWRMQRHLVDRPFSKSTAGRARKRRRSDGNGWASVTVTRMSDF